MKKIKCFFKDIKIDFFKFVYIAFEQRKWTDIILIFLWTIGIVTGFILIVFIFFSAKGMNFIPGFAILLSALIASTSVIKSIKHNTILEQNRIDSERYKSIKHLCVIFNIYYKDFYHIKNINNFTKEDDINEYIERIGQFKQILNNRDIIDAVGYDIIGMLDNISKDIYRNLFPCLIKKRDLLKRSSETRERTTLNKNVSLSIDEILVKCKLFENYMINSFGNKVPEVKLILGTSYSNTIF